jgi:hypothetical protein
MGVECFVVQGPAVLVLKLVLHLIEDEEHEIPGKLN